MAFWPKWFRCKYDMPSGPVEREFLVDLMVLTVISGVKNCSLLSMESVEDLSLLSSIGESADVGVVIRL